ncbi:hypothetical protein ECC02_001586 [Trypanosoma cruzi]|uniref:Uncharacterized protein n=1 Tax=Trypanosoma cruzi TaxID=5693 RepID=A0A7J6YH36_TRYCR|nr:hypothetical protein ECC02_001586 [Trypanosoma cruzi]
MSDGSANTSPPLPALRHRRLVNESTSEMNSGNWASESASNRPMSTAQSPNSPTVVATTTVNSTTTTTTTVAAAAAAASAEARALLEFGEGYHRILEELGNPGYHSIKALFYGEEGPPGNTVPSITVSFELFEAVQNRFATTKATLERTKEDLHTRHQQYALLEGQHEQLQGSYNLLEQRANDLERKNTQLLQDIAKQGVMSELLRQQVTRMKSEAEMIEEKMAKRDEDLQVLHNRIAEGLVSLSQKETVIANLRRQLGYGGRLKRDGVSGNLGGESDEYSPEALKRIAEDVEGRSTEARLRLCVVELEAKVRSVMDERKYVMVRHTMYRNHVQTVTESYEALCMSREDAMGSHVCEAPPSFAVMAESTEDRMMLNNNNNNNNFMRSSASRLSPHTSSLSERHARNLSPPFQESDSERRRSQGIASKRNSVTSRGASYERTAMSPMTAEPDTQTQRSPLRKNRFSVASMRPSSLEKNADDKGRASSLSYMKSVSPASKAKEGTRPRESRTKRKLHSATTGSMDHSGASLPLVIQHGESQGQKSPNDYTNRGDNTASPPNKIKKRTKNAGARDQGTQTEWHAGKRPVNNLQLSSHPSSAGRHNTTGSHSLNPQSPSLSLLAAAQSVDLSFTGNSASDKAWERAGFAPRDSASTGPFGSMLPVFEQQFREQGEESKNGSSIRAVSEERAHAGRATQDRSEMSERTKSATRRIVRSLAANYGELHAALVDLHEFLFPLKGNEQQGGTKPIPFYLDENNADAATQAEYLSTVVAADSRVLLHILNRSQRNLSGPGGLHPSPKRVPRGGHQRVLSGQPSETSSSPNEKPVGIARTGRFPLNGAFDLRPADVDGAGKTPSRRPEIAETTGGTNSVSASGKIHAADKLDTSLVADSPGGLSPAKRLSESRRTVTTGNVSPLLSGELTGAGENEARRSGKGGRISAGERTTSGNLSRVSQSLNSGGASRVENRGSVSQRLQEDGGASLIASASRPSNSTYKKKGNNLLPTHTSRNDKRGDAERHPPQLSTGEENAGAEQRGHFRHSSSLVKDSEALVGKQKDPQTTSQTKKTTPFLFLPELPIRGGDDEGSKGQAINQEGVTATADPGLGAGAGTIGSKSAPVLPSLSTRQRNMTSRGADRGRQGSKRLVWNAAVVRFDFSKLFGPTIGGQAPSHYSPGRQQSSRSFIPARSPKETVFRRALNNKGLTGRRQFSAHYGATPGIAFDTDKGTGFANAFSPAPSNYLLPGFCFSPYMHPTASIPSKNKAEGQFNDLVLGGTTMFTPSSTERLRSLSHSPSPMRSRWPQDPVMETRKTNPSDFAVTDHWLGELPSYGKNVAHQPPAAGFASRVDICTQEPPYWNNFYSNEQVLVQILHRDPGFWRLIRDSQGRARQPPKTFSSWMRRRLFRGRQLRFLLGLQHPRVHPLCMPLRPFNYQSLVRPSDLYIGSSRKFKLAPHVLGRQWYAKRRPRFTSLVKRVHPFPRKNIEPQKEFVPLLIRGLTLRPLPAKKREH